SSGHSLGAVVLAARRPRAFDDADIENIGELARPLALGIERGRLTDETRRRADELAALHATSQLITARLDVASVLDRISLSVPALIGASGCGIGLFNSERTQVVQAAAHGFQSEEWRTLSVPAGEGIIGRVAAERAGIAIPGARLFAERVRGTRETRALLEAGRAVTASLDVGRTIRMILEEARGVLGVDSCSVSTFDPATDQLVMVASLDVPQELVSTVRLRLGEGV